MTGTAHRAAAAPLVLPPGHVFEQRLATRPGVQVVKVRFEGRPAVSRLAAEGEDEAAAELAVLAAVKHPGLARLLDHGGLLGGGSYVTREWVEGEELGAWFGGPEARATRELGQLLVPLCQALEHLHAAGFAHADLKPGNVLVTADGRPVLADFGLAHAAAGRVRATGLTGTLFYVAPEVLVGGPAGPRSDLFALGVLLHELLVRERPPASEFYARFPDRPFLEAVGTEPEALPEWARDLVPALLARDPAGRPRSAAEVARLVASRLGLELPPSTERPRFEYPVVHGRNAWIDSWAASTGAEARRGLGAGAAPGTADKRVTWMRVPAGEEPEPFFRALRLDRALGGARWQAVDLSRLAGECETPERLDQRILKELERSAGLPLLALLADPSDAWSLRAAATLARAWSQIADRADEQRLVILTSASEPAAEELDWRVLDVPPVDAEKLATWLGGELDVAEVTGLEVFADALASAAEGAATAVGPALERAVQLGWIVPGPERPRLRSGIAPIAAELSSSASVVLADEDERRVCLAAALAGGTLRLRELREVCGWSVGRESDTRLADCLGRLSARRLGRLGRPGSAGGSGGLGGEATFQLRVNLAPDARQRGLLGDLHARRAVVLERERGPHWQVLAHRCAAAPRGEAEARFCVELEALRERGTPELGLLAVDRVERALALGADELSLRLRVERARCWTALGQGERALESVARLEVDGGREAEALLEVVRAGVALLRHEHEAAVAHAEHAIELDPALRSEAEVARIHALHHSGQDAAVVALVGELERDDTADVPPRKLDYVRSLRALSRFRLGEVDEARRELLELVQGTRLGTDAARRAALELDLATLERRAGSIAIAERHLESALRVAEESGILHAVAQAHAALGGLLRERGRLLAAEPHLHAALDVRERSGDVVGTLAVRALLGLLFAERGHVRPALAELRHASERLRGSQLRLWGPLLRAKQAELRARIGEEPEPVDASEPESADPRVFLSLARTRWLRGDVAGALRGFERARSLAERLRLLAVADEARWLISWVESPGAEPNPLRADLDEAESGEDGGEGERSLSDQDAAVRRHLLAPEGLHEAEALELATELLANGRDDRAARLLLSVATRSVDPRAADQAARAAAEAFARCSIGLTDAQAANLRAHLLGTPDPCSSDLQSLTRAAQTEDLEMEIVKLLEINHRLVGQEDLSTLLGVIVESALGVTGAERGFLVLEEDGVLRFDTALDSRRGGIAEPDLEVSRSVIQRSLDSMKPLRISNAVDDPLLGFAPSVVDLELRSILCAPFRVSSRLRGVVYLDHRLREGAFGERSSQLLGLLADQAALAIQQVKRMAEIRRLNEELKGRVVEREADLAVARRELVEHGLPAPVGGLIGSSPPMKRVRRLIERAAPTSLPVLVHGRSGTGKELAARALHALSGRSTGPFVSENCAAIPATIIEAELFGYRRGAFTGADTDRPGVFQRAHGGTLFLDEIGEMPLELQAKLLRVLETSEVRPLGESRPHSVDFRLVVATNRVLEDEVQSGAFREDLYYRLQGLVVRMPDLEECAEDIPLMVHHFVCLEEASSGLHYEMSKEVLAALSARPWPGNVRELRSEVARLCALSDGTIDDPSEVRLAAMRRAPSSSGGTATLAEVERGAIERALAQAGGDKRKAAELLGISRAKIYQRLKEWRDAGSPAD